MCLIVVFAASVRALVTQVAMAIWHLTRFPGQLLLVEPCRRDSGAVKGFELVG
jgi:hypothetical protein